jgi:hypothetical protein
MEGPNRCVDTKMSNGNVCHCRPLPSGRRRSRHVGRATSPRWMTRALGAAKMHELAEGCNATATARLYTNWPQDEKEGFAAICDSPAHDHRDDVLGLASTPSTSAIFRPGRRHGQIATGCCDRSTSVRSTRCEGLLLFIARHEPGSVGGGREDGGCVRRSGDAAAAVGGRGPGV